MTCNGYVLSVTGFVLSLHCFGSEVNRSPGHPRATLAAFVARPCLFSRGDETPTCHIMKPGVP
jgi:hypothetical protein